MIATGRRVGLAATILVAACYTISAYDPVSYKTATDLKAECLTLIEKSAEGPASQFQSEIDALKLKLRKALEYEKGKALNSETTNQWSIMVDPNRNMMGGFLKFWQEKNGPVSPTFSGEFATQVSDGFGQIIRLENGKRKQGSK